MHQVFTFEKNSKNVIFSAFFEKSQIFNEKLASKDDVTE